MDYKDIHYYIQILHKKRTWFFEKENIPEKIESLNAIQQIGTPDTIYSIIEFLVSEDYLIRNKTAEVIIHLFSQLNSQNGYMDSLRYLDIGKTDIDLYKVNFDEKTCLQLFSIASLNGNGYIRERAVVELGRLKDINGLKFILLRLSDWVLPVRRAAANALDVYLDTAYLEEFLQELPTIHWLLSVKRIDLTEVHDRIIKFIVNQPFSAGFYRQIKRQNSKTRLIFYVNLFKHTVPGKDELNLLMQDKNFLIRLEILKHAFKFGEEFQKELITVFLQDRSARIRVNVLYATKPYNGYFENDILALVSDRSASVRELSRQLLRSKGLDFAGIYRERIRQRTFLAGSLMGLFETGTIEDLPIFQQHIHTEKSEMITGCLAAINKYDPDGAGMHALTLLTHPIGKIRNKAIELLAKGCDIPTLEKIRQIYATGDDKVKKTILKGYHLIGGWNVTGDLLISLTDEDSVIQDLGWQYLGKWKEHALRLFTKPVRTEMERAIEIYSRLDRNKIKLTDSRAKLLEEIVYYLK